MKKNKSKLKAENSRKFNSQELQEGKDKKTRAKGGWFSRLWKIAVIIFVVFLAVFTFMSTWNDFMGPLLYLDKENLKTVSLALQNFMGQHNSEWNLMMALSTVARIRCA